MYIHKSFKAISTDIDNQVRKNQKKMCKKSTKTNVMTGKMDSDKKNMQKPPKQARPTGYNTPWYV